METAKFYCFDEISAIPPVAGSAAALPTGSVYMWSGIYSVGGQSWDFTRPGLYVMRVGVGDVFTIRIVLGPQGSPVDPYPLLSAVCWNHVHGTEDEGDYQTVSNNGRYQRWGMRCGYIAGMMAWLLPQVSLQARTVNVRESTPSVSFDYGHVVLEVMISGQWRMFDMTNGCYWKDSSGNHLSAAQFIAHIANNGPLPEKIKLDGNDTRWQHSVAMVNGLPLDLQLYGEEVAGTEAWLRRIFQAVV